MLILIILLILSGILFVIYERAVPVNGVPSVDIESQKLRAEIVLLDVRDYQLAAKYPVEGAFHLPFAYIKRHFRDISSNQVVIVASDQLLLNLSVRFLKRRGFNVIGSYITSHQVGANYRVKHQEAMK
jgi:rhodanese-related sulfurtransferase